MTTPDARLDLRRRQRLGMVEAVWGEHKTADQIVAILESFAAAGELGLVTRVAPEKAARVCEALAEVETVQERFETLAREQTGQRQGNPFPLVFEGELLPQ